MNIFKQLAEGVQNTEVTFTVENEKANVELFGTITFKKGGLERKKSYWARTYLHGEDVVKIDEWDGDWEETTFNGLKIDNYEDFIKGFADHGMKSVADSFTITYEDQEKIISQAVVNHKMFKSVYKKARLFELMTDVEIREYHFNLFKAGKYVPASSKRSYGWMEDERDLTIEQVIEIEKTK